MKRFSIAFLLIFCAFSSIEAQLLWEVSGNGLREKSYLFGTHHLMSAEILDSVPGVSRAFYACRAVVGEIAFDDPQLVSRITEGARMPQHTTMRQLFASEQYDFVDSVLKNDLKIGLSQLAQMRPIAIVALYQQAIFFRDNPQFADAILLDSFFQQVAARRNIPIVSLETVEQQVALLYHSQTLERQAHVLLEMLKNSQAFVAENRELCNIYRQGDLAKLLEFYENDTTDYAPTASERFALLGDRNISWVEKLPELMAKQPCFVAVGALHLAGDDGLIALLRKQGYKIKPVKK